MNELIDVTLGTSTPASELVLGWAVEFSCLFQKCSNILVISTNEMINLWDIGVFY